MRVVLKLFSVICLFLFCACGEHQTSPVEEWMQGEGKIRVLSTTAMIDDLVSRIGGEKVSCMALIVGEIDPHNYELVKGDDEKLNRADLIFFNGLGLEHGASLRYQLKNDRKAKGLCDLLYLKEPESFLFVDGQVDPHVWMDVSLWAKMVELIRDELILLEPKEESFFRERSNALKGDMEMLHENIYALLQKIPAEKRYLVTSHDAFNYFAKRYLREEGEEDAKKRFIAPEGLAPDGQLSTADIQRTIDHLSLYQIGVVFPESNVSRDSLKKIVSVCAQKGLDVRIAPDELYADAMGAEGSSADNYFKMMEHNAAVIAQSLQAKK